MTINLIFNDNKISNNPFRFFYLLILLFLLINLPEEIYPQPLAAGMEKFLGAATNSNIWRNFNKYFNQVTPGNDGKWGSVESSRGNYNWTNLDKIYDYAQNNNLIFKEHVLIWGQQQPGWISSLDSADQLEAIEEWIKNVGERYPDMDFAEVVNEPFNAPPSYKNALGGDGVTGWDWVINAFKLARKYCAPTVKLMINEYNVLHSNTVTANYINLINILKDSSLIDGVGIQGHYFEFRSDIDGPGNYVYSINTIKDNLNKLTETGIPVYITEFDIDEPDDENHLAQYQIYFPIFWRNPGVKGITFWGYHENDVWGSHPDTYLIDYSGRPREAFEWLEEFILTAAPPVLLFPSGNAVERNPVLNWSVSDSASSYHIQVSTSVSFTNIIFDTLVTDTLLQLTPLDSSRRYYWRISSINKYGESEFSTASTFMTGDHILNNNELTELPYNFILYQNYPNPFNPTTNIRYSIPHDANITIKVYNILGKEVATLFEGFRNAGIYRIIFNAQELTSGIYFYKLTSENFTEVKKFLLLK